MKTLVIGLPESLPPELADNPAVIVVDPATLPEELLAELDAASGGMLMAEDGEEGGEGPLEDWAGEEEKEHGMGGREGDEEETEEERKAREESGEGDREEEDPTGGTYGMGDEEDEEERKRKEAESGARGGRAAPRSGGRGPGFGVTISGRGAAIPALTSWARAMGRGSR